MAVCIDRPWRPDFLDDRIQRTLRRLASSAETLQRAVAAVEEAEERLAVLHLHLQSQCQLEELEDLEVWDAFGGAQWAATRDRI